MISIINNIKYVVCDDCKLLLEYAIISNQTVRCSECRKIHKENKRKVKTCSSVTN